MNIKEHISPVDVSIEIGKPGVYVFLSSSGLGKTFLANLLKTLEDPGIYIVTYDNRESIQRAMLEDIKRNKYELVFLDRYDMYASSEYNDVINDISRDTIVLVDAKNVDRLHVDKLNTVYFRRTGKELSMYA